MVADQNPSNREAAIWVNFLNQPTACLHGPETLSKQLGVPVVYGHCKRVNRGRYIIDFELVTENAALEPEKLITQKFMQILEDVIT